MQLLSFPFQLLSTNISGAVIDTISTVSGWITLASADSIDGRLRLLLYVLAVGWVLLYTVLVISTAIRFSFGKSQQAWTLKLLRAIAKLSSTTLFLPLAGILLQSFQCIDDNWAVIEQTACLSTAHIVVIVGAILLLPVFTGLSVFLAAVFIHRDIRPTAAPTAQVHGTLCPAV